MTSIRAPQNVDPASDATITHLLAKTKGYSIVLPREGVPANDPRDHRETGPVRFDDECSNIFSTCDSFDTKKPEVEKSIVSNDKMIIGYTMQGLPFQILVSGLKCEDDHLNEIGRTEFFNFIQSHILQLIPNYVLTLTEKEDADNVLQEMVRDINRLSTDYIPKIKYSCSIAILFARKNNYYAAGVTVGSDTGIVYIHPKSAEQLTYAKLNSTDNSHTHTIQVDSQGVLLGYIALNKDMLTEGKFRLNEEINAANPKKVHYLVRKMHLGHLQRERLTAANGKYDSHSMLGRISLPSPALQEFLQEYVKLDSILAILESRQKKEKSGKDKADTNNQKNPYQQLIDRGNKYLNYIYELKCNADSKDVVLLTRSLRLVNAALLDPSEQNMKALNADADQLKGSPSPILKGLGIAMMVLGGLIALLGGAIMIASACATASLVFAPISIPSFNVGAGMLAGGGGLFLAGLSFFAYGRHRSDFSKTETAVADVIIQSKYQPLIP